MGRGDDLAHGMVAKPGPSQYAGPLWTEGAAQPRLSREEPLRGQVTDDHAGQNLGRGREEDPVWRPHIHICLPCSGGSFPWHVLGATLLAPLLSADRYSGEHTEDHAFLQAQPQPHLQPVCVGAPDTRPGSLTCQMHVTLAKFLPLSKVEWDCRRCGKW